MFTNASRGPGRRTKGGPITDHTPVEPVQITSSSIPDGVQNIAYNRSLVAINGSGTKVWTLIAGTLPTGISLSSDGVLSGTPTVVETKTGIAIRCTDDSGFDDVTGLEFEVRAAAVGDHAYYDTLLLEDSLIASYSMRTQSELNSLVQVSPSAAFTYDATMDACIYYKDCDNVLGEGSDATQGTQNLEKLWVQRNSGQVLVTWDMYYPHAWKFHQLKKMFNSRDGNGGATHLGTRWITHFYGYDDDRTTDVVGSLSHNIDSIDGTASGRNLAGIQIPYNANNHNPTGEDALAANEGFVVKDTWTRYWVEMILDVPGTSDLFAWWRSSSNPYWDSSTQALKDAFVATNFHCFSAWFADESRSVMRLAYHIPCPIPAANPYWQGQIMEFNTSNKPPSQAYVRGTNAATNAGGNIITVAGADLTDIVDGIAEYPGKFKIVLGYTLDAGTPGQVPERGTTTAPASVDTDTRPLMRTITAVDNTAKTVTIDAAGEGNFNGNLTNTNYAICGPIYCWMKNWVALYDYNPTGVDESDTFIFQQP
jgi:hypothetical protein